MAKEFTDNEWVFTPDIKAPIAVKSEGDFLSSNQLFIAILESIQDGVSVLDAELNIKYYNASMGYWYSGKETAVGKKCYAVYHERTGPCENCPTLHAMRTKKPQVDLVRYRKNGSDYGWQQLYAVPVVNREGEIILVIEYIRDITFQKSVEGNLSDLENRFSALEEQNRALMDMLSQRERQQEDMERTVSENLEKFIKPSLSYLKKSVNGQDIDMVSGIIDEIVYPITKKRPPAASLLTSRELSVAALIKEGFTSKEIAEKLCITKKAVDYHRSNIRKKLGLGRDSNLHAYLGAYL